MKSSKEYRAEAKFFVDSVKSKYGCCKCKETEIVCLDFHHLKPEDKSKEISRMISNGRAVKALKDEINKCICVCCNCHRKIHAGIIKVYKKDLCKV